MLRSPRLQNLRISHAQKHVETHEKAEISSEGPHVQGLQDYGKVYDILWLRGHYKLQLI